MHALNKISRISKSKFSKYQRIKSYWETRFLLPPPPSMALVPEEKNMVLFLPPLSQQQDHASLTCTQLHS